MISQRMLHVQSDMFQILEDVWMTLLDLRPTRRRLEDFGPAGTYFTVAYVGVSGAWRGEVLVACDVALARYAAAQLLERPPAMVKDDDVRDTLYELGSIVAGNLKRLLPEPSTLHTPVVGYGNSLRVRLKVEPDDEATIVADCYGWPLLVRMAPHG